MNIVIFALVVAFVVGQVYVEAVNERDGIHTATVDVVAMHWWNRPLSAYLSHVAYWQIQQAVYYGLALALALLAWRGPGMLETVTMAVGAAGVTIVAASRLPATPRTKWVDCIHVSAAGAAFCSVLVYECWMLWKTPMVWLPLGGVSTSLAFARWAPRRSSMEEKAFALWLMVGLIAIVGVPL